MSELKSLMLWKNDFKNERDWVALCEALDLPIDTVEIEMNCTVCVAKSHYTHHPKNDISDKSLSDDELCFVGDHEKMVDFAELTKDEFLDSYSYLTEEEYDATCRVVDKYFTRAVNDFNQLREKVKSLPGDVALNDACDLLGGHNFTENECFDLNYGCLCVTVYDIANAGVHLSESGIEVWNDEGMLLVSGVNYDFLNETVKPLDSLLSKAVERSGEMDKIEFVKSSLEKE